MLAASVRWSVCLGAAALDRYAYSPDQLEYHYTKSKDVLRRAVAALQQQEAA